MSKVNDILWDAKAIIIGVGMLLLTASVPHGIGAWLLVEHIQREQKKHEKSKSKDGA